MLGEEWLAIFGLEGVYMDRAVRRLGGYVLVERIPGDALDVVVVVGDLSCECTC